MKKIKPSILYIIITIIVYLLGFLILLGVDSTSGGSEMFAGLEEALKALFTLSILIPIILFIGGVFLLKNNYKKKQLKRAIIHLLLIIGLLFLITLQYSFYSIFFIVPISVLITDYITKKDDKKTTKRVFIILIILLPNSPPCSSSPFLFPSFSIPIPDYLKNHSSLSIFSPFSSPSF